MCVCVQHICVAKVRLGLYHSTSSVHVHVCVCLTPQETVRQLHQFSELTYRYAVAAMKEEVNFDEAPDHFRGEEAGQVLYCLQHIWHGLKAPVCTTTVPTSVK